MQYKDVYFIGKGRHRCETIFWQGKTISVSSTIIHAFLRL
jgi:hypothetical protein